MKKRIGFPEFQFRKSCGLQRPNHCQQTKKAIFLTIKREITF